MKIGGVPVNALNIVTVVIKREDRDFIFKCHPVEDLSVFEEICPFPKPPQIQRAGSEQWSADFKDPKFIEQKREWIKNRVNYVLLKSIHIDDLEWETVDEYDPKTWGNILDELEEAGFVVNERARIIEAVNQAQGINDDKLEAARSDFLPGKEAEAEE